MWNYLCFIVAIRNCGKRQTFMQSSLIRLVVIQFTVYAVFGVLGFIAWTMAFSSSLPVLQAIVGEYFGGHFARWTIQFPLWGLLLLISAALSFGAAELLRRSRKEGAYIGIISFSIGFITNILFARNILVHSLTGALIGWTLLAPLVVAWKNLKA